MKHQYQIIINKEICRGHHYTYSYGRTNNIMLTICSSGAMIAFCQGTTHNPDDVLTDKDRLCADAIKKAMLIYLILYAKPLKINRIVFLADEQYFELYDQRIDNQPVLYSMITATLDHRLNDAWQDKDLIQSVLNTTKTGYDGRHNALIALLVAKSKEYRSEKFMYLWMAMNGFYNYLSEQSKKLPKCPYQFKREYKQHELMCAVISEEYTVECLNNEEEEKLYRGGISLLNKLTVAPCEFYKEIAENKKNECFSGIVDGKSYIISPLMFYSVWLPYKIRCRFFHANKAVPLFVYPEESTIKVLGYINYFVERFVETFLPEWMCEKEMTEAQTEKLRSAWLLI